MKQLWWLMIMVLFSMTSCEDTDPLDIDENIITDVSWSKKSFNPCETTVRLTYLVHKQAVISVRITDARGKKIMQLLNNVKETVGAKVLTWDGTDEDGQLVSSGLFVGWVQTSTGDRAAAVVRVCYSGQDCSF